MSSKIHISYLGDLRTEAIHLDSSSKVVTDAPLDNSGLGRKFSPTDLVVSALGSCLLTIMGIIAKRHKIDMTGSTIHLIKEMNENPRRIAKITADVELKGDISKEKFHILKLIKIIFGNTSKA